MRKQIRNLESLFNAYKEVNMSYSKLQKLHPADRAEIEKMRGKLSYKRRKKKRKQRRK